MARPKSGKVEWVVNMWGTPEEKEHLMAKAKEAGVSIGEYLLAGRRAGKPETEEVVKRKPAPEIKPVSNTPEYARRTLTAAEMMRGVK